jgi:CubicO group peptidase (beta-lactamase class C family)
MWMVAQPGPEVDQEVTACLRDARGHRSGDVAAALVDLGGTPVTRLGFVGSGGVDRVFEIGSVTKGLTGMLLADAVERGEVELGTPVVAFLPGTAGSPFGAVTLRQLATHTSGLPRLARGLTSAGRLLRYACLGLDPYRGQSPERVLEQAGRERLRRPGQVCYSNLGAAVCGQLLVLRHAATFGELLRDRILVPAGLRDTSVSGREGRAPWGRSALGVKRQPWIMDGYAPAGGVISTIADMGRLAAGLLSATAPGSASLAAVDELDSGTPDRERGLFWAMEHASDGRRQTIWHNGQTGGYSSFLSLMPDDGQAIIVLSDAARASEAERLTGVLHRTFA